MHTTTLSVLGLVASAHALVIPQAAPKGFRLPIARRETNSQILAKRDSDKTSLRFNAYWNANVTFGTQQAEMLLDTGSSDLWVIGSGAPAKYTQGKQTVDGAKTGAKEMSGYSFSIGYGTGETGPIGGKVYSGKVCMNGGACVDDMVYGLATTGDIPYGGILGLGFKGGNSIKPTQQETYMEKLVDAKKLPKPIMTFNAHSNNKDSYVEFGDVDAKSYKGQLQKIQTQGKAGAGAKYPYSWSISDMSYWSNNKKLADFDTVFDTGGPMCSGPLDGVRAYYAQIQGSKDEKGDGSSWTVPCNAKMPDLTWKFPGGAQASIPGTGLLLEASAADLQNANKRCTSWFVKENSKGRSVIGQPFFNEHVVIFDQGDASISWAVKADSQSSGYGGSPNPSPSQPAKPTTTPAPTTKPAPTPTPNPTTSPAPTTKPTTQAPAPTYPAPSNHPAPTTHETKPSPTPTSHGAKPTTTGHHGGYGGGDDDECDAE